MEVKINKEIRDYTESVYFGLSLRQFVFSILACLVAVLLYFLLKPYFGIETLSWVCILGAAPFAAIGFIKYNGMNAEEFVLAYIRNEFLTPKELTFKPSNYYYELLKDKIGDDKKNENNKESVQTG
ncbi:MAG: PrgI family protein [Bacilli bacterium]|nr:PrgI family protein [Bacilli bacterium]